MARRVFLLGIAVAFIWVVFDFLAFCSRAADMATPDALSADAVIALTGGAGLRIATGVSLIETGAAPQLLISGVHPDVTMDEMAVLGGGMPATYACCVELGYAAETTAGNASETAEWVAMHGHTDLIIVTSDYHMARSFILLRNAMPDLKLTAYPVRTRIDPAAPFGSFRSLKGLSWEWLKWRVTRLRMGTAVV